MSLQLDANYWNERYLKNDFGWDLGTISPPLKDYFDQIKNKNLSILIPGAGNSYEAEYLVNNGFTNVYVCDLAEEALSNLKKRCPAIKSENLLFGDFFELNSNSHFKPLVFDLIIEQTFFCAINPSLRSTYFKQMHKLLKPGGKLVGLLFDAVLNSDQPPFGGSKAEYPGYFEQLFDVQHFEQAYNSIKPREGRELFINLIRK